MVNNHLILHYVHTVVCAMLLFTSADGENVWMDDVCYA